MQELLVKLVDNGLLSPAAADDAKEQFQQGIPFDQALIDHPSTSEIKLLPYLANEYGLAYTSLEDCHPPQELIDLCPAKILQDHNIIPIKRDGQTLHIATSKIFDNQGIDQLRFATDLEIIPTLAPANAIKELIKQKLGVGAATMQKLAFDAQDDLEILDDDPDNDLDLESAAEDASIIKFVNQILTKSIERKATDVHIETFENNMAVRFRVDGVLQNITIPPQVKQFQPAIVSRIKILAHLDIAEKRLPQDGRIKLKITGREIDVRVSVIPMLHGEAIVLRLLDRSTALMGLEKLGWSGNILKQFNQVLTLPHGIILVTGPTGSGKTSTLYAALATINDVERKIITIEDPIEYNLEGINQIQVSTKAGLTFATGLRAILRHDPDVVLIGEIRDSQTAQIAVQASLTGHLVFSTLHTNDAPGALTRLVDMGVEPYLVASTLEMVVAQRLVRLICVDCKTQIPLEMYDTIKQQFPNLDPTTLYHGTGCQSCQNTGYNGRQAIFELMPITPEIRTLIQQSVASIAIRNIAIQQGMISLRENGLSLATQGTTTIDEVMRVTKDEHVSITPENEKTTPQG